METSIPGFYHGKSVFITGGMGFLGKVLVEKLLRSCPGIENVYLLVRSKKNKSASDRREELLNSKVFDISREKNPQAFEKIVLIEGDVTSLDLGISKVNRELLCEKVSIVINSAATVKFDEPLRIAVNTNLRSLQELIKMSREMKNLKSFVHISTAYTNWFQMDVKETFYETQHDPYYMIDLCNNTSDEKLQELKPQLIGKHTNTYTFTKALAEVLFSIEAKDLPATMIRPSIVGGSMVEPHPGWTDAYSASTPFLDVISRGLYRSLQSDKNIILDLIPADFVINMVIAASWKVANDNSMKSLVPNVYNSVSGTANPITFKQCHDLFRDMGRSHPSEMLAWYPQTRYYKSRILCDIDHFLTHLIPAYLLDISAKIRGQTGKNLKMQQNIAKGQNAVRFVWNTPMIFQGENYQKILKSMNKTDQEVFYFDPRTIIWKNYIKDFHIGVRKFIFNDGTVDSALAKRKLMRFKYGNYMLTASAIAASLFAIKECVQISKGADARDHN